MRSHGHAMIAGGEWLKLTCVILLSSWSITIAVAWWNMFLRESSTVRRLYVCSEKRMAYMRRCFIWIITEISQWRNFRTYQHYPLLWGCHREVWGNQESNNERNSIIHGNLLFLLCLGFQIVREVIFCDPLGNKMIKLPTERGRHDWDWWKWKYFHETVCPVSLWGVILVEGVTGYDINQVSDLTH